MAEITTTTASVATAAVSATAASVALVRTRNTAGVGISGHSERNPNAPQGVKISFAAANTGASQGPLYVRAFGAATAVTHATATTAGSEYAVQPNTSIVIPAGEAVNNAGVYTVKVSGITGTGGLGTMTAEWVDKTS